MKTSPSATAKLTGFAAAVALVFGAAYGVARAVAPDAAASTLSAAQGGRADVMPSMASGAHDSHATGAAVGSAPGLATAEAGYRFAPEATVLAAGPAVPFRFRILGTDGQPVARYGQLHERELHLIVVRRDLTGFQHVHPVRAADGTWAVNLNLQNGGVWRAFADFAPVGGPAQLTLGVDLQVPGDFTPGQVPTAAAPADPSLEVGFDRKNDDIEVSVQSMGIPTLPEPYLGARGHLVALRAGDLAYLHVHPVDGGNPAVRFKAELPTAGRYALFFDYQVGGVVHTATSTTEVQ